MIDTAAGPIIQDMQVALDIPAVQMPCHNGGESHRHIRRTSTPGAASASLCATIPPGNGYLVGDPRRQFVGQRGLALYVRDLIAGGTRKAWPGAPATGPAGGSDCKRGEGSTEVQAWTGVAGAASKSNRRVGLVVPEVVRTDAQSS